MLGTVAVAGSALSIEASANPSSSGGIKCSIRFTAEDDACHNSKKASTGGVEVSNTLPFVTVIICTYNRASSLSRALESLCEAATRVGDRWELLVVDNRCTDDTPAVIERFKGRLPITRLEQPAAGISNARNAGVAAARGEYVVWTDDDVVVNQDWLAIWIEGLRAHPGDAVFGGRARPVLEEPQQAWFRDNLHALRSLVAHRDQPDWTHITSSQVPYGLNFAVRTAEQKKHLYDPGIGVAPGRTTGGEEVTVVRAILAAGGTGRWIWGATVNHMISPSRQTESYINRFYTAHGYRQPLSYRGGRGGGPIARAISALRASLTFSRATASYAVRRALRGRAHAVPKMILKAQAFGSLKHYLGLPC